ncbi:putative isoflavone reductase family protein [Phaeomoniella chlamydospora]|uniref:Putative isoflavone reductase family protein n=1 Tax=Phaeomoniella chlamydospora TaxID=158046 RepID=A0A0G2GYK4_PHACM|nr:putative isoflavone reductase family protein [Phaeomoniella chlamydospora]
MSIPRHILVIGLGELGLPVTLEIADLASKQEPPSSVSVLVRPSPVLDGKTDSSKTQKLNLLQSLGVSLLHIDLAACSKDELVQAFVDYDCIVSCTGFVGGSDTIWKTVYAVYEAKVPYFIPWQFGVDYDQVGYGSAQRLWSIQLDVRRFLRSHSGETSATTHAMASNTQWTIVQTVIFTSFLFEPWFEIVDVRDSSKPIVRALGGWENKVSTTSPKDIGKVTAMVVFDPSVRNQVVKCAGDTVTYAELADIVGEALGIPVKRELLEVEFLESELKNHSEDNIKMYQVAFAKGTGCSWPIEETVNHRRHLELQGVREFAMEKLRDSRPKA